MERRLDIEKEQDSKQEQEQNNKPMYNPVNVCHRYIINLILQLYRIELHNVIEFIFQITARTNE
jgi:hypothetical protein